MTPQNVGGTHAKSLLFCILSTTVEKKKEEKFSGSNFKSNNQQASD